MDFLVTMNLVCQSDALAGMRNELWALSAGRAIWESRRPGSLKKRLGR